MSCEQFSLPAALKRKEWMYVNCQTVSCQKLINGPLVFPANSVVDGDYVINAGGNVLNLVPFVAPPPPTPALSYFQGTGFAPYPINVGPPTAFQITDSNQVGNYVFSPASYQLTVSLAGTYKLTLSSTMANPSASVNTIITGFMINGVQSSEKQINQTLGDTIVGYNNLIVQLPDNSIIYPYAYSTIDQWVLYSSSFMVEKMG